MPTLFKQPPRMEKNYPLNYADDIAQKIVDIQNEYDLSEFSATEAVRMSIDIHDYDVKDEQLAGLGELLLRLVEQFERGDE
ncbi:hypothetical protein [Streptococcus dysgalactiae]|uniref:hypothetical protein n=1 Tax=Streptococcus dysgalactiae TaxID=1334 RepID=UPI001FA94E12|nr:hypothetical protein [Streptococcus dysgalactiae]